MSPDLNFVERAILKHELKKYLGRLFEMKLTTHLIWQGLAMVLQYGDQATDIVPPKGKPFVALALGLAQVLLAWRAHYFNPDGTPAAVAFVKK